MVMAGVTAYEVHSEALFFGVVGNWLPLYGDGAYCVRPLITPFVT